MDTSFHGPFGAGAGVQPLVLSASLSNVSLCLRFRCSLKRGALSASVVKGSLAGLDRSSLTLELADVRVLVGDIVVSIADGGSRNENGEEAAPSLVWKLFSRALSTTLRAMVEEQAAIAIREAVEEILRGDLPTGGRSKRRGGGGAPPPSTLPASPPLSTDAGLGEEAATGYEQEGKPDEQQQEQGNKQASAMAEEEEEAPAAVEASSADGQGAALSDLRRLARGQLRSRHSQPLARDIPFQWRLLRSRRSRKVRPCTQTHTHVPPQRPLRMRARVMPAHTNSR